MEINFQNTINVQPLPWTTAIRYLENDRQAIFQHNALSIIRTRLECGDGVPPPQVLARLLEFYPSELALSLLFCTIRFPTIHPSTELMNNILDAIETYGDEQMRYLRENFHVKEVGTLERRSRTNEGQERGQQEHEQEPVHHIVIGEVLILLFASFHGYFPTMQSGNIGAIQVIRQRYPLSILYIDSHDFNPIHGVCTISLNMDLFRFFIEWHQECSPGGRGGLYEMNDSGITALDTLIDTQFNVVPMLQWLHNRNLLKSRDVQDWQLIHRAAHSSSIDTIQFFLDLLPGGVMSEDDDNNIPLNLHLTLRYRHGGTFSDEDFSIVRLLVRYGIINGGMDTIGGLFRPDPENEISCTLASLLKQVGDRNAVRTWNMIDEVLNMYAGENGGLVSIPIVHLAILNNRHVSKEIFQEVLRRHGARHRDEKGELPLSLAVKMGVPWNGWVDQILRANSEALTETDDATGLPLLPLAALNEKGDLNTVYELARLSIQLCCQAAETQS